MIQPLAPAALTERSARRGSFSSQLLIPLLAQNFHLHLERNHSRGDALIFFCDTRNRSRYRALVDEALQLFIGAQTQYLFSATGSISFAEIEEDDVEQGLEFKRGLEESTATSSSVMLSGARREKETPDGLDIGYYSRDLENSDPPSQRLWRGKLAREREAEENRPCLSPRDMVIAAPVWQFGDAIARRDVRPQRTAPFLRRKCRLRPGE